MLKGISVILLFLNFYLFPLSSVFADFQYPAHVFFINQVRGSPCCQEGSLSNVKKQVEVFVKYNIPAYFVLRYDVLTDNEYTKYFQQMVKIHPAIINIGIFIEIIPSLAEKANISYKGSKKTWHEAQNLFTIGYSPEERKKLTDTLFKTFHNAFGFYPKVTSSWMIDTPTLNYIHSKYAVAIHQITREQWGTDSYTLYGGPPHYPYPPSENWLFIPDYERSDPPLIVRQTITDPLFNYGDTTNAFTSQPNDYTRDKKTFAYFTRLLDMAIKQDTKKGFALLGLENSMADIYQDEYLKQIAHINTLKKEEAVTFPTVEELVSYWKQKKVTLYRGQDVIDNRPLEGHWITTPRYRMRLKVEKNDVSITDMRIFDPRLTDPYNEDTAKKGGFWITPYLIDGSYQFPQVKNDVGQKTTQINLPEKADRQRVKVITHDNNSLTLGYKSQSGKLVRLLFTEEKIIVKSVMKDDFVYTNHNPQFHPVEYIKKEGGFVLQWKIQKQISHALTLSCNKKDCTMTFSLQPHLLPMLRKDHYLFMFPEPAERPLSQGKTVFYAHNQYAIAGRNPIRIIVAPHDQNGFPTILSKPLEITSTKPIDFIKDTTDLVNDNVQYLDIENGQPLSSTIIVKLGNIEKKITVFFAPNCKKQPTYCLVHPKETFWYIKTIVNDKIRAIFFGERQK